MTSHLERAVSIGAIAPGLPDGELIPATIATATPVNRYGAFEVLDCTPAGVDLERMPLPLLIAHNSGNLAVGIVEQIKPMGDRVTGLIRFSSSPEAQQIRSDVLAGIHRALSVGYRLLDEGTPVPGGLSYPGNR